MKNKKTKKSFDRFAKKQKRSRRTRDREKEALLRAVMETNVGIDALRLGRSDDLGRGGRVSHKSRRDETRAEGIFSASKSGFGFVCVEGAERDIFIPEDRTLGAISGDRVEIIYHAYTSSLGEEKTEGRVKRIVEYGRTHVIGTLEERRTYRRTSRAYILIPDDPKIPFVLDVTDIGEGKVGDKVMAKIVRGDSSHSHRCTVTRTFGYALGREANYEAILAECEIPTEFSAPELAEAEFFASMPLSEEGRVRRGETIFTIDGEGAKDLDDAVSLRKIKGGWQLGVHIADVSVYVKERTHLDRAVMARGTSVYFTDKVVPMLPRALSNGACSLNPDEDKYTLSAIINLNAQGEIVKTKIEPSIIRSRVRGVYSEVNKIFSGEADGAIRAKYKSVLPSLMRMRELYRILKARANLRGSLELESSEAEILLGEDGMPVDIVKRTRGEAEELIEQFMICANEAVATLLSNKGIPCVFRVHEEPPREKLSEFITYVHNLGFDTGTLSMKNHTPSDFSRLLAKAEERGILKQVSYAALRTMSKAKYSDVRAGHFGLGLEYYAHFTSPIRRLSDLATHRIIHKVLLEERRPEIYAKYAHRAAAAATETEIRAVTAERRIENLYKVLYMSDRIGECYDATINSVTSFGFFAELENTCEGLVPISELYGAFVFDEKHLTLRFRDTVYRIGDKVRIRVEEADVLSGKLRFSVVR